MADKHYIYLIPGFFGFADIGGITYFHHVREFLEERLLAKGIAAEIVAVKTAPTASIRHRAGLLLDQVHLTASDEEAPIHLVGHSTGGLDARLFVTPGASLPSEHEADPEAYAARVRSVTTVATPHYGTPMASFFSSLLGAKLLYLLSLGTIYTLQFGKLPLTILLAMGGVLTRLDDRIGLENTVLDQFYDQLFSDFDEERQLVVRAFLEDVRRDQALIGQLTPGGIDLFNASTSDRDGVRYASVVTRAVRPGFRSLRKVGLHPYQQASHLLYRGLYFLAGRNPDFPRLRDEHRDFLKASFGEVPSAQESDGIVPTLSQLWGEVIHATHADHLDICGHFDDASHAPPHVDWITTGTGFERSDFEAVWSAVADFIAR